MGEIVNRAEEKDGEVRDGSEGAKIRERGI